MARKFLKLASRSASARVAADTVSSKEQLNSRRFRAASEIAACDSLCSASADKFNAPVLAHFRAAAHKDQADLAGAFDVGAAARLQVGRLDLDRTEDASRSTSFRTPSSDNWSAVP